MTAARALDRLNRLLREERAALLAGKVGDPAQLSAGLERAMTDAERSLDASRTGTLEPKMKARLAERLRTARQMAEANGLLVQASIQGIGDAQALLGAVTAGVHGTYAADGTVEPHAAPRGRLHRKT